MTGSSPPFDDLERGHVVLAPDPFRSDDDATRPWVVVNNEHHPFDKQQYIVMGLTTRTWYDERIPLEPDDYRHRAAPRGSSIVPHAVASLGPSLMTDYVCRIRDDPLDRAVSALSEYLWPWETALVRLDGEPVPPPWPLDDGNAWDMCETLVQRTVHPCVATTVRERDCRLHYGTRGAVFSATVNVYNDPISSSQKRACPVWWTGSQS